MKTLLLILCVVPALFAQPTSVVEPTNTASVVSGGHPLVGDANHDYTSTICARGTPDTIKFAKDGGSSTGCQGISGAMNLIYPAGIVSAASWSAGRIKFATSAAHNLISGVKVFVAGASPSGYNVSGCTVILVNATQFGCLQPSNPGTYVSGGSVLGWDGVTATFASSTGHSIGDAWMIHTTLRGLAAGGTFVQRGRAAVVRDVQDVLRDRISVKDFGAAGNVGTDSTTAFQVSMNFAASTGGGVVEVPPGTYLLGALTMRAGVELHCASMDATRLLAKDNSEQMFTFSKISSSGISNCRIDGNGKTGVQAIEIDTFPSVNHKFRDLAIEHVAGCVMTSDTYFDVFDNIRCHLPTERGYLFAVNSNSITCNDCSVIAITAFPVIGLQVNNSGAFSFNGGTIEGTATAVLYQVDDVSFRSTYFENTDPASVNPAWVQVGTSTGSTTAGITFSSCTFGVGADYALDIYQVAGLVVQGSNIVTKKYAYRIENLPGFPVDKRALNLGNNSFNINSAGYDSTKIIQFSNNPDQTLGTNINQDQLSPLMFTGIAADHFGATITMPEPPDASLQASQGAVYADSLGLLRYKYKGSGGSVHRAVMGGDRVYFNQTDPSLQHSLSYALNGTDGALLRGYGGVAIRRGATANAAGICMGQFGGYNQATPVYFTNILFGPNYCLPLTGGTISETDGTAGAAFVHDVIAGDTQGTTPLSRWMDHALNIKAHIDVDGSGNFVAVYANGVNISNGITALTGDCTATGPGSVPCTLAASGVTAGTYGNSANVAQLMVDAKGRVTSAGNVAVGSITINAGAGLSGGGTVAPGGSVTLTNTATVTSCSLHSTSGIACANSGCTSTISVITAVSITCP
jgi:hypothetical protein